MPKKRTREMVWAASALCAVLVVLVLSAPGCLSARADADPPTPGTVTLTWEHLARWLYAGIAVLVVWVARRIDKNQSRLFIRQDDHERRLSRIEGRCAARHEAHADDGR